MKKELEEKLYNKYPEIFTQHDWDMSRTCLCWGLPGKGWYNIIDDLCQKITDHCKETKQELPQFVQVKEKFGLLRIYTDGSDDHIYDLIHEAEEASAQVCERCGSKENVTSEGGWILTLCKECREKKEDETSWGTFWEEA